jgi:hypothetical protein
MHKGPQPRQRATLHEDFAAAAGYTNRQGGAKRNWAATRQTRHYKQAALALLEIIR